MPPNILAHSYTPQSEELKNMLSVHHIGKLYRNNTSRHPAIIIVIFMYFDSAPLQPQLWPPFSFLLPESSLLSAFVVKLVFRPYSDSKLGLAFASMPLLQPRCQSPLVCRLLLPIWLSGCIVLLDQVVRVSFVLELKPWMPMRMPQLGEEVGRIAEAVGLDISI